MWVTTPTLLPLLPTTTTPTTFTRRGHHITTTVSATASSKDVGGLGQAVLTALNSSPPKPITNNDPNPNRVPENKPKELNGSDILWALQKASAKKAQVSTFSDKKKRGKGGPGARLKTENAGRVVGFDTVRPVVVKSDWVTRLDELDNQIQAFLNV
ncbi:hypothetical protein vseg_004547 [Gypsophila vaccaria]